MATKTKAPRRSKRKITRASKTNVLRTDAVKMKIVQGYYAKSRGERQIYMAGKGVSYQHIYLWTKTLGIKIPKRAARK